jgi:hypothetical protein
MKARGGLEPNSLQSLDGVLPISTLELGNKIFAAMRFDL